MLFLFFADEATREERRLKRKMIFISNKYVARRVVEAGNHGIGFVIAKYFGSGVEVGGGKKFDVWEVFDSFLSYRVFEFWKDNFHRYIIA